MDIVDFMPLRFPNHWLGLFKVAYPVAVQLLLSLECMNQVSVLGDGSKILLLMCCQIWQGPRCNSIPVLRLHGF